MSIEPIYKRIGARLRGLRESRKLTQEEAASRAGIPRPELSRLENGRHRQMLHVLEALAPVLEVTLAQLVAEGRR